MQYDDLEQLRRHHPAWRLLCSEHVALVASFLHRCYIVPNLRGLPASELAEQLEDLLYHLRQGHGEGRFPKSAQAYLDDWAGVERGWLRKYYPRGSEEAHYDLAPSTEKAIGWLATLGERSFVGTESRLLTLLELLRQMREGSDADPAHRLAELERRRAELDRQIERARAGDIEVLDDTALKERYQQFLQGARELLGDFREVEHNFRLLDRRVRERIAQWEGSKGALLAEVLGERDAIADSDQGRSFRAFWDFLMSQRRQEEFGELLQAMLALPAVQAEQPDPRLRRVHYDWLDAGEHTQRTVALLSQQLRRFLDDQAWLENRRIIDLLRRIEQHALQVREQPPQSAWMSLESSHADIDLPFERPLHTPAAAVSLHSVQVSVGEGDVDSSALFEQVVVDRAALRRHLDRVLAEREQVSLAELLQQYPLRQGLAELLAWLQLAQECPSVIDDSVEDHVEWSLPPQAQAAGHPARRRASLPRLLFVRPSRRRTGP